MDIEARNRVRLLIANLIGLVIAVYMVVVNIVLSRYVWLTLFSLFLLWFLLGASVNAVLAYRAYRTFRNQDIKVKFTVQ